MTAPYTSDATDHYESHPAIMPEYVTPASPQDKISLALPSTAAYRNLNVFFFLIYAILGWMFEVSYCLIIDGELVNRGFLHGPYCPIYGFGAIILITQILPRVKSWVGVFFTAIVVCTIWEYFTSWYMETVFGVRLWDYSTYFLNFEGRVCLWNSLLFGVLALAVTYVFQPFFTRYLVKIPGKIRPILSILIVLGLLLDLFSIVSLPGL